MEDLQEPAETESEYPVEEEAPGDVGTLINQSNEYDPNLVPILANDDKGKVFLKSLVEQVIDEIEEAIELRSDYVAKQAAAWKLCIGHLEKRKPPFQDSANMHVPIMLENLSRIVFHSYGELFNDWKNVWGVLPMGPEDDLTAEILTIHGNWQLRQQIPGFKRQMHRGLMGFFCVGDVTSHSYWDAHTGLNCHDMLGPDEFITPYSYTTTSPDYSDIPWYAKCLTLYRHELERYQDAWYGVEEVLERSAPDWSDEPERKMAEAVADLNGIHAPTADKRAPFKLWWYEGYVTLPGQKRQRFVKCIVDPITKAVLLLCILETDDWQDKQRYELQSSERDGYFQGQQQYAEMQQQLQVSMQNMQAQSQALQQHLEHARQSGDQMKAQEVGTALQQLQAASSAPLPPPPQPPAWMVERGATDDPSVQPDPIKKQEIRLFAHGVCIEPLEGNLGIGYGTILADFNRPANAAISQFTDAAALGNGQSFVATEALTFDQNFRVSPGRINKVTGGNLKDNFMPLAMPPANPQLLELVDKMRAYAQSAAQSPEVLGGEPGKSGETFRGIAARIEQATKILSVTTRKFLDFFEQILKNNAYLNSVYLRDEEIFLVVNHALRQSPLPHQEGDGLAPPTPLQPPGPQLRVGRKMYERNYDVEFRADLRFASMAQRISEADEIVSMAQSVPVLAQNAAFQFYAVKKALEARGRQDLIALMGPPPPPGLPPPPPPGSPPPGGQKPPTKAPAPPTGGIPGPQPAQKPQEMPS